MGTEMLSYSQLGDRLNCYHKPMPARSPATKPPDVSAHRRGPQQRGFERRDGRILSSENPDPQRVTATFERRVDGWVL